MRFMESQDEDRITYFCSSNFTIDALTTFKRTMPMATVLFTVPGFPMIWNGQEVGWGYGIPGAKEARNRSIINWNYQGRTILTPHYQRLATLRGQFRAFTQHKHDTNGDGQVTASDSSDFIRVPSGAETVYAYARPFENQNGVTAVNFGGVDQTAMLDLTVPGALRFTGGVQPGTQYYLNDHLSGLRTQIVGSSLNAVRVLLPAYGSAVYTLSLKPDTLRLLTSVGPDRAGDDMPQAFALLQNYPNPFNGISNFGFRIAHLSWVTLKVFDLLGREVATLVNEQLSAGEHRVTFDGSNLASGVYLYRLTAGQATATKTMVLLK
jgi:hypothetical protein